MATPPAPPTAGQAATPSTPATPRLAAKLVAREDLPANAADRPTLRATPAPRWTITRESSKETVRMRDVLPRPRPLTPRPRNAAQRRTPSEVQAAHASLASLSAGPMDTVQTDVRDSGRARSHLGRSIVSARPATSQDYRLTEEQRASRASAAARAADRSARTAGDRSDRAPSSVDRADTCWADRDRALLLAEEAAVRAAALRGIRDELEDGFEQAFARPIGESMLSRPATGPGIVPESFRPQAATPLAPWRQNSTRTQSLAGTRCGPNVMGPYRPSDLEGNVKG
jgi:hypothetical protein